MYKNLLVLIQFRFTNRQRTRKSAEAFARGAFPEEEKEGRVVMTKPRERDPLLKVRNPDSDIS